LCSARVSFGSWSMSGLRPCSSCIFPCAHRIANDFIEFSNNSHWLARMYLCVRYVLGHPS
jgi:hypothetical protein